MILRNTSLAIFVLAIGFLGCAKRAQVPKAPYQIAVEEYYRELDKAGTGDSLEGASAAVKSAIAANPANLETRVLYLNILLQRAFISSPPPDARTQFIAEFKRLHLGPPGAPGPDWVKPRTYVTFGDYLLRSGTEDSARQEAGAAHLAKAAYQAASEFYLHGHKLAASVATPTEGAIQERINALDGYTQSQRGFLDMLANLSDANSSGPAGNGELTRQLGEPLNERLSLVFSKGELPAASFSATMVTPSALIAQSRFYQDSANRSSKTLIAWCEAHKALIAASNSTLSADQLKELQSGLIQLKDTIRFRETQLARQYLSRHLYGLDETASALGNLAFLYKGLAAVCGAP